MTWKLVNDGNSTLSLYTVKNSFNRTRFESSNVLINEIKMHAKVLEKSKSWKVKI